MLKSNFHQHLYCNLFSVMTCIIMLGFPLSCNLQSDLLWCYAFHNIMFIKFMLQHFDIHYNILCYDLHCNVISIMNDSITQFPLKCQDTCHLSWAVYMCMYACNACNVCMQIHNVFHIHSGPGITILEITINWRLRLETSAANILHWQQY